jgi:hypothetical protein
LWASDTCRLHTDQALNTLVFRYRHVLENVIAPDHLGKFELLRRDATDIFSSI